MRYDMRRSPKTPEGLSLPGDLPTRLGILAVLTIVYFAAGKLGLGLAYVHASASAVWPPTGIALAALLVLGNRVWPAILLGAFLVNLSTAGTVATSAAIAAGNTLEGLVGAYLVRRFAGGVRAFDGVRDILRFVAAAAIVATAISATIGTTTLGAARLAPWTAYGTIWLTWWLGDAAGAVLFTPFLVLAAIEPSPRWTLQRIGEAALLFGALGAAGTIVFHGVVPPSMIFLCVPFPFWAAFRFGRREAAASAILLSTIAVWGTFLGYGPFVAESPNGSLLLLQVFMGGLSVMILAVAAVVLQAQRVEHELRVARDDLEDTVSTRTESLRQAVKALEHEVLERTRAEHELRESELRMRGLLEASPDAMVVVDSSGTITEISAQVEKLFGYRRSEIVGRPVDRLVPERLRTRHHEHRNAFSADPHTRTMGADLELYALRSDHSEFPVEISLSPVRTAEGVLVRAAIRDITDRKRVERKIRRLNTDLERRVRERTAELERSNEALKEFAYAASHDLQEPVRTMGNYAEILARRYRGRLDADADEFLGFIVDGADWMHQLLQGLLEYSRVEMRPPVSASTPMDQALEQALGNLGAAIAKTGATVTSATLPAVPGDGLQMVQLFQNLVGNAIKFRRPGVPPEVRVDVTQRDSEWLFAVHDNGIGIDLRHAKRIFAIFQRLHRRPEYPGAGVGLAICRKIVELHGGRIWVESPPDGGSTFLFTLPVAAPEVR
jgi:PAS domain S-box-containing protein